LRTHTQVLSPEVAKLVPPDAGALAAALAQMVDRPDERARLAAAAAALAATKYSRDAYVRRTAEAYARLVGSRGTGRAGTSSGWPQEDNSTSDAPTRPARPTSPSVASQ
jgi:hypothetical protein